MYQRCTDSTGNYRPRSDPWTPQESGGPANTARHCCHYSQAGRRQAVPISTNVYEGDQKMRLQNLESLMVGRHRSCTLLIICLKSDRVIGWISVLYDTFNTDVILYFSRLNFARNIYFE